MSNNILKDNTKCQWNTTTTSKNLFIIVDAVLTSTHNLCFGAKIRKIGIPLHTPVLLYKSGVHGGRYYTEIFSWWKIQCLCFLSGWGTARDGNAP